MKGHNFAGPDDPDDFPPNHDDGGGGHDEQGHPFGRAERLIAQFERFDLLYPDVWSVFERVALELAGERRKYTARAVFDKIRWQRIPTSSDGREPKIPNNHSPFYARRFLRLHPECEEFFITHSASADGWNDEPFEKRRLGAAS